MERRVPSLEGRGVNAQRGSLAGGGGQVAEAREEGGRQHTGVA